MTLQYVSCFRNHQISYSENNETKNLKMAKRDHCLPLAAFLSLSWLIMVVKTCKTKGLKCIGIITSVPLKKIVTCICH